MDDAIHCEDLRRVYSSRGGETTALAGINLSVERGCVFGVLGPNGAGKTTAVRILSTLLTPTSGKASVLGFDVMKSTHEVRSRIGLVLGGDRGLYGRLTGRENLLYFAALNRMRSTLAKRRVAELIDMLFLSQAADNPVETYSRGMRQRLHVARGLMTDPEIIFMDEPTIGLDPAVAREIREFIPKLAARGKTVLLTTHYMMEADVLCDRIALIDHGKIVAEGSPTEIKRKVSQVLIIEIQMREVPPDLPETLHRLPGVIGVERGSDGLLQRVTVQAKHDSGARAAILDVMSHYQAEAIQEREPTLEEAYLTILG